MGLWDKVKSVAMSAKCMTGWHAGEYTSIEGKPKCNLEKTCPDCNKYMTKISHKMSSWNYLFDRKCDAVCHCIHCNFEVIEVRHNYHEVRQGTECRYIDTCDRCGDMKQSKIRHNYEERGKDSNCRIIEVCKDCGDKKSGRENHNFLSIAGHDLKVNGQKKCKDCGKMV